MSRREEQHVDEQGYRALNLPPFLRTCRAQEGLPAAGARVSPVSSKEPCSAQAGSREWWAWEICPSPPCHVQGVQVCQRGWGWTKIRWLLNSIIPLGPKAHYTGGFMDGFGLSAELLPPSSRGFSSAALDEIPTEDKEQTPLGKETLQRTVLSQRIILGGDDKT